MFERLSTQVWVGSLLVIVYPSIVAMQLIKGLHLASTVSSGRPYSAHFLSRDGMIFESCMVIEH